MEEKEAEQTGETQDQVDNSKRNIVAALLGSLGVAALSSCTNQTLPEPSDDIEPIRRASAPITGTEQLRWVDWIGTEPSGSDPRGANLRDLDGESGEVVVVEGFWEPGDGGGGVFYWDENTACVDDGGTVIVSTQNWSPTHARTGPAWKRIYSGAVHARWFGTGTNDDQGAIQAALATAASKGQPLVLPSGIVRLSVPLSISASSICIVGAGRQRTTILPVEVAFSIDGELADLHFSDFTVYGGTTPFAITGALLGHSRFERLTLCCYSGIGFDLNAARILYNTWDQVQITGGTHSVKVHPTTTGFNSNTLMNMTMSSEIGFELDNSAPAPNYSVANRLSRISFEGCAKHAIRLHACECVRCETLYFEYNGSSTSGGPWSDIKITGEDATTYTRAITFSECFFSNNSGTNQGSPALTMELGDFVAGRICLMNCNFEGYRRFDLGSGANNMQPKVIVLGERPQVITGDTTNYREL